MNEKDFEGKMVMVPRHMYCREHVAYCMYVDDQYIYCIDWNGNRDRLNIGTVELREATIQEIAEAATHDCKLNAQEYDFG